MLKKFYDLSAEAALHSQSYGGLIDSNTGTLLVLSQNLPALVFLAEATPHTWYAASVNRPNYQGHFFLLDVPSSEYPNWTWDSASRRFEKTKAHVLTEALRASSRLLVGKCDAVVRIMNEINASRTKLMSGLYFQERVYASKKSEAERFKDSGYDEGRLSDYPYLLQYADYRGIPGRQAADDILLQASFMDEWLLKTEFFRLKYLNRVREADSSEALETLLKDFKREFYVNARV